MYLYAIGIESEFMKFGIAQDPQLRLSGVQTGCPVTIYLLAQMKVQNRTKAGELERLLHSAMQPYRLRGEWFNWTQTTSQAVACLKTHDASRFRLKVQRWLTEREYFGPGITRTAQSFGLWKDSEMVDYISAQGSVVRRRFQ